MALRKLLRVYVTILRLVRSILPSFLITLFLGYSLVLLGLIGQQPQLNRVESDGWKVRLPLDQLHDLDTVQNEAREIPHNFTRDSLDSDELAALEHEKNELIHQIREAEQKPNINGNPKRKTGKKKNLSKLTVFKEITLNLYTNVLNDLERSFDLDELEKVANCSYWNDTVMPRYARICKQKNVDKKPLITLFTTMHVSKTDGFIQNNTLHLWSLLGSRVRRILFVSSPAAERPLIQSACSLDWDVITAPLCDRNKLPVLKAMFMAAQQIYDSTFYGYANGDIVFDKSLLSTLDFISDNFLQSFKRNLIIGRRTNVKLNRGQVISSLPELRQLVQDGGQDGWVVAVDFFISSKNGYYWSDVPKFVIGRVAYDNWLVRNAAGKKYAVIDITNSSLSVHQMGQTGYYSSHRRHDPNVNARLIGGFDFTKGLVSCAKLRTKIEDGMIKMKKRTKFGMCGAGHWAKRNKFRYGNEIEVDFTSNMKIY